MRIVGTIIDVLVWRLGVVRLDVRTLVERIGSNVLIFGSTGLAVGYAVMRRLAGPTAWDAAEDDLDAEDDRPTSP